MAGVATPAMAAAVSEEGALGGLGLGASSPENAAKAIADTQRLTDRPFQANFFCHSSPRADNAVEREWLARAAPLFRDFRLPAPTKLEPAYTSFRQDDAMLQVLLEMRPAVASFHFGLPREDQLEAMRESGLWLMTSATCLEEAKAIERAGLHAIIAQGWEAGGHRGIFDPDGPDEQLGTEALTRLLARECRLPVIAAGGLSTGRDVLRALEWGAIAAQIGTAFIACPESAADADYRRRLEQGPPTVMTRAISGRPARCLANSFTQWAEDVPASAIPDYPIAYTMGKAIAAAARTAGETGFGAQWAGMSAGSVKPASAAERIRTIASEMQRSDL